MKYLLSVGLAFAFAATAQAQVFRPQFSGRHDSRQGAAPHFAGGHRHGFSVHARPHHVAVPFRSHGYSRYLVSPGFGYYEGYTGYDYPYYRVGTGYYGFGSAAASGLLLGALAGGIIGHNSGDFRHNGWRGAAWGAGVGWLLGTIADANRRPVVYQPSYPIVAAAPATGVAPAAPIAAAAPAQPVTIINNYYGDASPMSGANLLFGR